MKAFAAGLLLLLAGLARADSFSDGTAAYARGDYAQAAALFEKAAAEGGSEAMNRLGEMLATGKGVSKDYGRAAAWFRKGAGAGSAAAQNNLGEMYANGWGVAPDFTAAKGWFEKAAAQGSAAAHYNLGKMLAMGAGAGKDAAGAEAYLKRAIELDPGNLNARNWLGSIYLDTGEYADAERQFASVLDNGGTQAELWGYSRGQALLKLGRIEEARKAFEAGLSESKSHNRGADMRAASRDGIAAIDRSLSQAPRTGLYAGAAAALAALAGAAAWAWGRRRRGVRARPLPFASVFKSFFSPAAPALSRSSPLTLGGKFVLGPLIGEGGMGEVYEALDTTLERKVAIKRMRPELKQAPEAQARFKEEAKAVARLRHPYIVTLHEIVEAEDELCLVLEYIEGMPLSKALGGRALPLARCKAILGQVCEAVEYAHRNKVIHRDLKPANIMIDSGGYVKVMDFGLARIAKDTLSKVSRYGDSGSPAYMAPEQHLGKAGRSSDIFSLGVCLYEMLAGRLPFPGGDLLSRKERRAYDKLAAQVPGISPGAEALVDRALSPDPEDRFRTVAEFSAALMKLP
ncbi:MAG: protein kinase [Elusimicrobia bacterium]|nr:protein kinase [Elusimicrobiota bacterium]